MTREQCENLLEIYLDSLNGQEPDEDILACPELLLEDGEDVRVSDTGAEYW